LDGRELKTLRLSATRLGLSFSIVLKLIQRIYIQADIFIMDRNKRYSLHGNGPYLVIEPGIWGGKRDFGQAAKKTGGKEDGMTAL
jgi:hypothetical protein